MRRDIEAMKQIEQLPVTIEFYHCDHLGTPIALTDQRGQITWAARHDPWGNIEEEFNPNNIEQNIRLPGQYHDRETGLYYNRFRYYDPKIGGYTNQDPVGLWGSFNLYDYCRSDPLNYLDPQGLQSVCDVAGVAAATKKATGIVGGAEQMKKGSNELKKAAQAESDVEDCVLAGPKCKTTTAEMDKKLDEAQKNRSQGLKDIGHEGVNLYKNLPGTIGGGPLVP
jgi:RHS repeat-associated protein